MHIHIHHHYDEHIKELLTLFLNNQKQMIMKIEDLIAKVQQQKTVEDSAVALLQTINQQLKDALAAGDQAKLQELSDAIDANTKELSDAITANTATATGVTGTGTGSDAGTGTDTTGTTNG